MRRNAMGVNLRQSIVKSFGRYIAIVLIIALGSGIFVGLLMTKSDMVLTGQEFMDEQNMFDVRMVSTYGWDQDQVDAAAALPDVVSAEGVLYMDLIANAEVLEGDNVFRFYALSDTMNTFSLRGGRMPEREDECLADGYVFDESILGTKVTLSTLNDEDTMEDVAVKSFTVVGYGSTPIYMDMNRGTTSVGSGVLSAYFYVPACAFQADYFPEIHLTLPEKYDVYSDAYVAYMEQQLDRLEPEAEKLGEMRFAAVKQEAEEEYADGYQEYLDGLQEYEDGKLEFQQELEDAWQELKDGEAEIIRGTRDLNDAEAQLKQTEADLEAGLQQLNSKEAELKAQLATINANIDGAYQYAQYLSGMHQQAASALGMSRAEAQAKIAELQQTDPESAEIGVLSGKLAALNSAEAAWQDAQQDYDQMVYGRDIGIPGGLQQIDANRAQIEAAWKQVDHGWFEWNKGWEELKKGHEDLKQGFIDYEEGKLEGEQELRDAELELQDAEEELREAREDIDALEKPDIFVLDRTSNAGYNSLDSASDIVQGVSRIIPVFFLLVASLVCITTMTRMVDEERTQIGTLKALGYSNAAIISKYLIYGGSGAVLGCGLGVLAGSFIFPKILWDAYKIMLYIREDVTIAINWWLCGIVVAVYTAVILTVTWYCCRKALQEQPAELIRPKAPDPGKQIACGKAAPVAAPELPE